MPSLSPLSSSTPPPPPPPEQAHQQQAEALLPQAEAEAEAEAEAAGAVAEEEEEEEGEEEEDKLEQQQQQEEGHEQQHGGGHEKQQQNVSASPPSLVDAQRLFDSGCEALRAQDYDEAAENFSRALEIRAGHFGELALECASTYYKYGCALFYKVQAESEVLNEPEALETKGETTAASCSKEKGEAGHDEDEAEADQDGEEAEEDLDNEDESDLDLAWKMLDIARAILEKQLCHTVEEVDVITALADVSLEREDFEMCFRDYTRALDILEELVEPDNRRIAELCFKLALSHQLGYRPKDALKYCQRAVSVCETRLRRLKSEVAVSKFGADVNGLSKGKAALLSNDSDEANRETLQEPTLETGDLIESDQSLKVKQVTPSEKEIEEIELLLEELREKVCELEEMATGPSLLDAFKIANPAAVDCIKQVFTASAKLASGDARMSSSSLAGSSSNSFDVSSSQAGSSSEVTHLGIVGRGIKRAAPVPVAASAVDGHALQPKKRTLDDMMMGSGTGETMIGFGATSSGVVDEGNSSANGQGNDLSPLNVSQPESQDIKH